jgi:HK97 family phage portal protein
MGLKLFGYEVKKASQERQTQEIVNSTIANFLSSYARYFTQTPEPIGDGVTAYATITDVYAIIQYISLKFSTVPAALYKIKSTKEYSHYRYLIKNGQIKEAAKQQKKAMEEQVFDNPLTTLLKRPNRQQGQDSYLQQVMGYRLSGGAAPVWMNRGQGQTGEPVALHCLLPSKLKFKPDPKNPFYRAGFEFDELGINMEEMTMENLLYWAYWTPEFDTVTFKHLYGFSPLAAAAYTQSANQEAQKAAYSTFKNKGVLGIAFPDMGDAVIPDGQKSKLREDWNLHVNNNGNRGGIFMAGAKMGYVDVGATAHEMELLGAMKLTQGQLCNVFQFPPQLFNADTTFSNVTTAGKQLITNKIMPEWTSYADEVNHNILPKFKGSEGYVYMPDFSMLYEMQEDAKFMMETYGPLFDRGIINGNDMRDMFGWDPTTEPEHNRYWINANYQPLDEAGMPLENDQTGSTEEI